MKTADKYVAGVGTVAETEFAYNGIGRITDSNERLFEGTKREISYGYDQAGNLTSTGYPYGFTVSITPEAMGRIDTIEIGQTEIASYEYIGPFVAERRYPGPSTDIVYQPSYDNLGRLTSADSGTSYAKFDYGYDPNSNNIAWMRYDHRTNDPCVAFEYDNLDRLRKIKDEAGDPIARYIYDELGTRDIVHYANGTSIDYAFDMGNRLSSITNNFQEQTFDILKFEYDTYDNVGNRKDCDITLGTTTLAEYDYGYDCLYELTELDVSGSNFGKYVYDKLGNRKKTIINSNTVTYSPNALNQYKKVDGTQLTYDNNGNLTYDGVRSYSYDCENRLTAAGSVTYKYDFAGRRIRKIVGQTVTSYVYDGARVIAEYVDDELVRKYVYGPGIDEPVCMICSWATFYYHYDGLGSVVGLSDEDGYLQEYYEYDVFGEPTRYYVYYPTHTLVGYNPGSGLLQPFMFTGREYDFDNGLYYYRFRFYHPTLGRFMQTDPIGYYDSMNLYAYCFNDPVNLIDPYGLKWWVWEAMTELSWRDHLRLGGAFLEGAADGAAIAANEYTFGLISPLDDYASEKVCEYGTAGQISKWSGRVSAYAAYAAAAVGAWNAAELPTMDIAISKGASPSFIHFEYGVNGVWQQAVGPLGNMWTITGSGTGLQITGIPILYPEAVMSSRPAFSCLTAVVKAFLRGWGA